MAKLTSAQKKKMSGSKFAGPGKSFPIPDDEHARKAIQLGARSLKKGNISRAQYKQIVAKARKQLRKKNTSAKSKSSDS